MTKLSLYLKDEDSLSMIASLTFYRITTTPLVFLSEFLRNPKTKIKKSKKFKK